MAAGADSFLTQGIRLDCEARDARDYAFQGALPPNEAELPPCRGGDRHRIVFVRSTEAGPTADLCWRFYVVCGSHHIELQRLDQKVVERGQSSRLRPYPAVGEPAV
jgi:hypothetical protein